MMLTSIEKEFLSNIQSQDVPDNIIELASASAGKMFGLDASKVKPAMVNNFVFKLYTKLMNDNLIPRVDKDPILHVLNNVANFRLTNNDRLLWFVIGEMRAAKLPSDSSLKIRKEHVIIDNVVLI